jgi:hypothetical protein
MNEAGYVRFYLAPKIDEGEEAGEAAGGMED